MLSVFLAFQKKQSLMTWRHLPSLAGLRPSVSEPSLDMQCFAFSADWLQVYQRKAIEKDLPIFAPFSVESLLLLFSEAQVQH